MPEIIFSFICGLSFGVMTPILAMAITAEINEKRNKRPPTKDEWKVM